MRSTSHGPIAFSIGSIVSEPGVHIDSTQVKHQQHQQLRMYWNLSFFFKIQNITFILHEKLEEIQR